VRSILSFGDHKLVDGMPNEELSLLIIATIANCDVSLIFIDEES
jgi:hypothetical protein